MHKEFYSGQSELTAAKIKFYENYIQGYLFKLLMGFRRCFIFDLFCGSGKNGDKNGSPLVLIDRINYALSTEKVIAKKPRVVIVFNDCDSDRIAELKQNIKNIGTLPENIEILYRSSDFKSILENIKNLKNGDVPKFVFLDPFTYSDIAMDNLRAISSLKNTECLFFVPAFQGYRFVSAAKEFKVDHKTRVFIESFTTKSVADYDDFDDFIKSIKQRLILELRVKFVRPIILDAGSRKHALFLITNSRNGVYLANKLALQASDSGRGINTRDNGLRSLFGVEGTPQFREFKQLFVEKLRGQKMTNDEIIDCTLQEGFLPKHACSIVKELVKNDIIKATDKSGQNVGAKHFYVSEKPIGIAIFEPINKP